MPTPPVRLRLAPGTTAHHLMARGMPESSAYRALKRGWYCPAYNQRAYPQLDGPGGFATIETPERFVRAYVLRTLAQWEIAPRRAVYLSSAANCDGPLPSGLRVVHQPIMRASLAVSGPPSARVASSRTHLPPLISRSSGAAPTYSCWGWGHGGTRNIKTSRSVHIRLVNPAAIAGVQGRHCLTEPVPLVGTGCGRPQPGNYPIGHRFSPDQTITVLDPRHPLCGQTLPLVTFTHHAQLGRCCVVWLRPYVERLIPVHATYLAFDPTDLSPSPLSLAAVEQLLRVFHDIQHANQGVSRDASPSRPSCTPTQARRPDCASSAVEPPVSRPTTARPTGAHRRRTTVAGPSAQPTPH